MARKRALEPRDLLALKYVHDARWSPDGGSVAYVTSWTVEETGAEPFSITIEDVARGTRNELNLPGRATFPRWSPDGRQIAFIGQIGTARRLYLAERSGSNLRALTSQDIHVQGPAAWSPDGSAIACSTVTYAKFEGLRRITQRIFRAEPLGEVHDRSMSLHLVDVASGMSRDLHVSMKSVLQPAFSPDGRRLLFLGSDAAIGRPGYGGLKLFTLDLETNEINARLAEGWSIAAAAWSPAGDRIVVAGAYHPELAVPTMSLWIVDEDGANPECRTQDCIGNVGMRAHHDMPTWETSQGHSILIVPDAAHAYATVATRGRTEIWRIALAGPQSWEVVATGARSCLVMDVDAAAGRLLYCASDLHRPWELFSSDSSGSNEKQLTNLNDAVLSQWPQMRAEHLTFTGADGLALEGWFFARADSAGPQPTVMFIHGGPFLATGHAFRFDFHLLAANGYAVLFANFRGSAGYGEAFARRIMGDWGGNGFPDHMAAVDAAVAGGLADEARLGVWGASHGGFATAWIVGHTERFRAAVAESSVTSFTTLYYICDSPDMFARDLGGRPDQIPDVYRARSPLTYANRCTTPTLMLHGEDDLRCPVIEAEQFYRALHDAGCVTELVRIPGMNHMGDSTGPLAARVAQNEALLDWFERHL